MNGFHKYINHQKTKPLKKINLDFNIIILFLTISYYILFILIVDINLSTKLFFLNVNHHFHLDKI